jgi:zinc protease
VLFESTHPYGRPAGGTTRRPRLDRARVAAFYQQYYTPGDSRLLFVGDITPDEGSARRGAVRRVRHVPSALPAVTPPPPAARVLRRRQARGAAVGDPHGNVGVERATSDYYAIQVLNTLLGGAFTSRSTRTCAEAGYTYGASSQSRCAGSRGRSGAGGHRRRQRRDQFTSGRIAAPPEDGVAAQHYRRSACPASSKPRDAAQRCVGCW